MYQIDFTKPQSVHFVGISGISMSGLAEILMDEGFKISGSDAHESELTRHLEAKGAVVYYGQKAENIKDGIDAVVYTAAIHEDNPEFMEVKRRGIPMMSRAELLRTDDEELQGSHRYRPGHTARRQQRPW